MFIARPTAQFLAPSGATCLPYGSRGNGAPTERLLFSWVGYKHFAPPEQGAGSGAYTRPPQGRYRVDRRFLTAIMAPLRA